MLQQATKPMFRSTSTKQKSTEDKYITPLIKKCQDIISVFSAKDIKSEINVQKENKGPMQILSTLIQVVYELVVQFADNMDQLHRIQKMLQKQQNLNRTLIKKELECQQEHKILVQELCIQRNKCNKLNEHILKLNDETKDKELTILHIKNELKACQKEKKMLDDTKGNEKDETQFKNYLLKDINQDKIPTVLKLGHKRRNSEDVTRKTTRNEAKKKQKIKNKEIKAT